MTGYIDEDRASVRSGEIRKSADLPDWDFISGMGFGIAMGCLICLIVISLIGRG